MVGFPQRLHTHPLINGRDAVQSGQMGLPAYLPQPAQRVGKSSSMIEP
jgi:hypothetical protein